MGFWRLTIEVVSLSSLRLPWKILGHAGGWLSKGFLFDSAADVLDNEAGKEGEGVEVGFGLGDGYDEVAVAFEATDFKSFSDEAVPRVAVETDVGEVGSES